MPSFLVIYMSALSLFLSEIDIADAAVTDMSMRYQGGMAADKNEWVSILSSIEFRLKNLDNLYTSQLTPTLETRLEHFQNRISGMEIKLLRVEALLTTKLDRMSDNISSRHFRDDMVQTDMFKKIETAYDGITHRLAYMDRKYDNGFTKTQIKADSLSKMLGSIDEAITTKYDAIESQLSDLSADMSEMKTSLSNLQNRFSDSRNKRTNMNLQREQYSERNSPATDDIILENTTKGYDDLHRKLNQQISISNKTEKAIHKLSEDIGQLLNDYASKVSDLGAQVTKSDNKIATHLRIIENVTNSTKSELRTGVRSLMVQVGKKSDKAIAPCEEKTSLADLERKLDGRFDKIIANQNLFLESCHRVQMDESQMESQISEILNKLIDNYEKTTRDQHHLLKKVEGMVTKHDVNSKKELYQINANVVAVYEQYKKESKAVSGQLKQTVDNLEALFALVQNTLGHNPVVKRGAHIDKEVIGYIKSLEAALNFTKLEQLEMFDSYQATIETLLTLAKSTEKDQNATSFIVTNLTKNIEILKEQLGVLNGNFNRNITSDILKSVRNTYQLVKINNEQLGKIVTNNGSQNKTDVSNLKNSSAHFNTNTGTDSKSVSSIDKLIREIFFNGSIEEPSTEINDVVCLDMDIDVRFESDKIFKKCKNQTENNETQTIASPSVETNCLDFDIDVRFSQDDNATTRSPRTCNKTHEGVIDQGYGRENISEASAPTNVNHTYPKLDVRFGDTNSNSNIATLDMNTTITRKIPAVPTNEKYDIETLSENITMLQLFSQNEETTTRQVENSTGSNDFSYL